jgi:hypothetical protein
MLTSHVRTLTADVESCPRIRRERGVRIPRRSAQLKPTNRSLSAKSDQPNAAVNLRPSGESQQGPVEIAEHFQTRAERVHVEADLLIGLRWALAEQAGVSRGHRDHRGDDHVHVCPIGYERDWI